MPETRSNKGEENARKKVRGSGSGGKLQKKKMKLAKKSLEGGFKKQPPTVPQSTVKKGNLLYYERTLAGITVVHFNKSSDQSAAYMAGPFEVMENDNAFRNKYKILNIVPRRAGAGSDDYIMQGDTEFPQMSVLVVTGTDRNTAKQVKKDMKDLAVAVNAITTKVSKKQLYPKKTHLADELTPASGPRALDNFVEDKLVVELLKEAYSGYSLEEIGKHDDVVSDYFSDVQQGKAIIREEVLSSEEGGEEEEEDSSEDEEEGGGGKGEEKENSNE